MLTESRLTATYDMKPHLLFYALDQVILIERPYCVPVLGAFDKVHINSISCEFFGRREIHETILDSLIHSPT